MKQSRSLLVLAAGLSFACSGVDGSGSTTSLGGAAATGGSTGNGGATSIGGTANNQGGAPAGSGGFFGLGGTGTVSNSAATGGAHSTTGGSASATGGTVTAGGAGNGTGGTKNATGGVATNTGGTPSSSGGTAQGLTGGAKSTGGAKNTGGSSSTGGSASTNGGTASSLHSSSSDPTYATAGAWHGYIWPAIESGAAYDANNHTTITPTAAAGFRSGGPPYCISGHVPATPNSLAVAMVGMNTNQSQTGSAVAAQWTTTGTGILVNVSNSGGSPLRLQIQTNETGAIATLWCAMLTVFDKDVIIAWNQFNTQCFNNNRGTYFDQSVGISTVMVLVPGTSQTGGYDFNFCLNNMVPAP